jgi:hypothetical protein
MKGYVAKKWFFEKAGVTEEQLQAHLARPKPRDYEIVEGWLDEKTRASVGFGSAEIYRTANTPLVIQDDLVEVGINNTTTSIDLYVGQYQICSFSSLEEAKKVIKNPSEEIKFWNSKVGDMYQNGVGRWADHR